MFELAAVFGLVNTSPLYGHNWGGGGGGGGRREKDTLHYCTIVHKFK